MFLLRFFRFSAERSQYCNRLLWGVAELLMALVALSALFGAAAFYFWPNAEKQLHYSIGWKAAYASYSKWCRVVQLTTARHIVLRFLCFCRICVGYPGPGRQRQRAVCGAGDLRGSDAGPAGPRLPSSTTWRGDHVVCAGARHGTG